MKRLALILTLTAFGAPTLAAGLTPAHLLQGLPFEMKSRIISASPPPEDDENISQPIRTAKFKTRITKTSIHTAPDGSLSFDEQDVCILRGNLNVYDTRGKYRRNEKDINVASCPSTLGGAPVTVWVGGLLDHDDAALVDSMATWKFVNTFLGIWDSMGPIRMTSTSSATSHPKTSSFVLFHYPQIWECSPTSCRREFDEYHSAIFEIED